MIMDIKIIGDPILRQKAKAVDLAVGKNKLAKIVQDMAETMLARGGVGLAGPQVGVQERLIVIKTKDGVAAFVNPVVARRSWKKEIEEEGCLSVPGTFGLVKRNKKIKIKAYSDKLEKIDLIAEGFLARVFQHEIDHLDGILFIDKAIKLTKTPNDQTK